MHFGIVLAHCGSVRAQSSQEFRETARTPPPSFRLGGEGQIAAPKKLPVQQNQFGLFVVGTNGDDEIVIQHSQTHVLLEGGGPLLSVCINGQDYGPFADVENIFVRGYDGDDFVRVVSEPEQTVTVWGGSGEDNICVWGSGLNTIYGGPGDDWMCGSGMADSMYGEGGDDIISGFGDGDFLSGGPGDDYLFGYFPKYVPDHHVSNTLVGGPGADTFVPESFFDVLEDYDPKIDFVDLY